MVSRSQEIQSLEVDPWQFFCGGGGGGRVCGQSFILLASRSVFGFSGTQRLQFGIWLLIWGPQSFWGVVGGLWCLLGFSQLRSKQWCDFMRSSQAENSSIDDDDVVWGMMLLLLGMASLSRNFS